MSKAPAKRIAAALMLTILCICFPCGCGDKSGESKEIKTGIGIAVSRDGSADASDNGTGLVDVFIVAAAVGADKNGNIVASACDGVHAKVQFGSDGCILSVSGTPESIYGGELPGELADEATENALRHAQFLGAEEGDMLSMGMYVDFNASRDALKMPGEDTEPTGLADAVFYGGYTFERDEVISAAGLLCKDFAAAFDGSGKIGEISEEELYLNERLFFADYSVGKTKKELADTAVDFPSGKPALSELLRYCNINILPFIKVLK